MICKELFCNPKYIIHFVTKLTLKKTILIPCLNLVAWLNFSESPPRHVRRSNFANLPCIGAVILLSIGLQSCSSAKLPSCVPPPPAKEKKKAIKKVTAIDTSQILLGIDGSGSMQGHVRSANPSDWRNLLQSINLSVKTLGLSANSYRIGGGEAQLLGNESVTKATNPCFFEGCGSFAPVASSLQTLWQIKSVGKGTPLRLLVSDLEVNQNDISSLVSEVQKDLAKGASVGMLALKIPFSGQVFNAQGKPFFAGKLDRPVYILATGKASQVQELLEDIRKNMSLKGIARSELSLLNPGIADKILTAKSVLVMPQTKGQTGLPLAIGDQRFSPSNNSDYQFVRLNKGATGISIASINNWSGGTTRPDLGIARLERIPLEPGGSNSVTGVRIKNMSIAGTNFRLDLEVSPSTPSGALRATIPRGSLPEQWWIEWDRGDPQAHNAKEQTEGLLLLMTTLGQQIFKETSSSPAASLCVVFQH